MAMGEGKCPGLYIGWVVFRRGDALTLDHLSQISSDCSCFPLPKVNCAGASWRKWGRGTQFFIFQSEGSNLAWRTLQNVP